MTRIIHSTTTTILQYLIVHIDDHALRQNQKIHISIRHNRELAGKPRVSVPRAIVAAQFRPNNAACTQLRNKNAGIRYRRPRFNFRTEFGVQPRQHGGVGVDVLSV